MPVTLTKDGAFAVPAGITGTFNSLDVQNTVCRGVKVTLNLTANAGGLGSVVLKVQGRDPGSGNYYDLLTSAALTAVATTVFIVHPALVASTNLIARDGLPGTWRVTCSGNGNPVSYTIGFSMVP